MPQGRQIPGGRQGLSRRALLGGAMGAAAATLMPRLADAAPLAKVKANGVLRVAIYQDNAPWSWDEGGQIRGIDADLGRALAEALGVKADLAIFSADESVEDDLRNAVWRGGLLGFQAADVMLHVPFDPAFAAQVDQVAIVAPYAREKFGLACATGKGLECEAAPVAFKGHKLAVELATIPDYYLMGQFGGALAKDVVHFPNGAAAVSAMVKGDADAAMATAAQLEYGLKDQTSGFARRKGPLPMMTSPGWDVGMAVKEASRTLGDALDTIVTAMQKDGRMAALCTRYGVTWQAPLAAG